MCVCGTHMYVAVLVRLVPCSDARCADKRAQSSFSEPKKTGLHTCDISTNPSPNGISIKIRSATHSNGHKTPRPSTHGGPCSYTWHTWSVWVWRSFATWWTSDQCSRWVMTHAPKFPRESTTPLSRPRARGFVCFVPGRMRNHQRRCMAQKGVLLRRLLYPFQHRPTETNPRPSAKVKPSFSNRLGQAELLVWAKAREMQYAARCL